MEVVEREIFWSRTSSWAYVRLGTVECCLTMEGLEFVLTIVSEDHVVQDGMKFEIF